MGGCYTHCSPDDPVLLLESGGLSAIPTKGMIMVAVGKHKEEEEEEEEEEEKEEETGTHLHEIYYMYISWQSMVTHIPAGAIIYTSHIQEPYTSHNYTGAIY